MHKEIVKAFKNLPLKVKCKYIGGKHKGVGVNGNNVKYVLGVSQSDSRLWHLADGSTKRCCKFN